jgi:hypothetical protein
MRKLAVVMMALLLGFGVDAMAAGGPGRGGFHGGGFARPRTTVIIGGGYSPFYSPFGYYGMGWGAGYGAPYYGYGAMPYRMSKLDRQVAEIRADYADRIESVRMDRSLTGKERRAKVRAFKQERDEAVHSAKVNYYKS